MSTGGRRPTVVRAAYRHETAVAHLLFLSAPGLYAAYAGSVVRAEAILAAAYGRGRHSASYEVCRVADAGDGPIGVLAGFPAERGDRLARRMVTLNFARMPPWRWPAARAVLQATESLVPAPPGFSWYVDALAVAEETRGAGVGRALLEDAEQRAGEAGCTSLALETQLENHAAQRLYESAGFKERTRRVAPADVAGRIGATGYVAYVKELSGPSGSTSRSTSAAAVATSAVTSPGGSAKRPST